MKKNTRKSKKEGFAETKRYPHKQHPANYRRLNKGDDIEYLTTTHHDKVVINGQSLKTIPLKNNINPKERGKKTSYVYPKVFVGKRSQLGKERHDLSFIGEDIQMVEQLYKTLPKEIVKYQTNSKNKKK